MEKIEESGLGLEAFRDEFEPELLKEIDKVGTYKHVAAGETIVEVGETIRAVPIVLNGTIKISRPDEEGREILLYYVFSREGCAMSFSCCMEQLPSEIKAVAEEDVDLLMIPIKYMDAWTMQFASWKSFVLRTMRNRFNELLKTIDQVAFQKLDERLVSYLKAKADATGSTLLNLSHADIANDLATSRVVISRLLKKLEDNKKLLLYRNQIKLLRDL